MAINSEVLDLISQEGKVAVITGAASGIGRASAIRLAQAGAGVALLDINETAGPGAAEKVRQLGGKAKFYLCNVAVDKDCRRVIEEIVQDFGRIDILFNNAGVIVRKDVVEQSEREWDLVVNVNLKGIFLMSHYAIPHMKADGGGVIVNTGSGWGLKGGPKAVSYCATKAAVVNMTRAMAIDHGKDGIRVMCVCPGDIDTPLLRDEAVQLGEDMDEYMADAADRPIPRVGEVEDVANTVLFLVSGLSSWSTGSNVQVDGGGNA
ncbi:MAG: SDR family oxidoreductase [Planctomycetes bacterium]|nr:SDR family oxidoreductase [Planctomycetota bacterium]